MRTCVNLYLFLDEKSQLHIFYSCFSYCSVVNYPFSFKGILTTSKRQRDHSSHRHSSPAQQVANPELHSNLRRLHRSARELKQEVRVLRRLTQLQSMAMKDLVQDTYLKLREACISFSSQVKVQRSAKRMVCGCEKVLPALPG